MIKDDTKRYSFMQEDHNGLLRGTYVEHTEPTSAHHQAAAMVDSSLSHYDYVKISGSEKVVAVERFKMLLDDLHPDDPRKSAAPTIVGVRVELDRLRCLTGINISVNKDNWPMCILNVCLDYRLVHEADINYVLNEVIEEVLKMEESRRILCCKDVIIDELKARIYLT